MTADAGRQGGQRLGELLDALVEVEVDRIVQVVGVEPELDRAVLRQAGEQVRGLVVARTTATGRSTLARPGVAQRPGRPRSRS